MSGTVTGFANSDTLSSATTGTLTFGSSDTASSPIGSYAVIGSGLSATNYVFVQAAGNATALTVSPATLTYVANTASRTYGSANPAFTGTVTGFVNNDTLASSTSGTLSFASSATAVSAVGTYAIDGSGLSATNYVFVQSAGNATALTVNPATLTYVADTASRPAGSANPVFTGTVTGFVNNDSQTTATTGPLTFTSAASQTSPTGSYAINGSGLTAANYVFVQAAGNATALTLTPLQSTSALPTTATAALTGFTSAIQPPAAGPASTPLGNSPINLGALAVVPPPASPQPPSLPPPPVVSPLTALSDTPNSSDQATSQVAGSLDGGSTDDSDSPGNRPAAGSRGRDAVFIPGMLASARLPAPPPTDVSALSSFGNSSLWQ